MKNRTYLLPNVIELNLAAGRPLGVNIYVIDGGTEFALIDIGMIDTLRNLDFPLSKCKFIIATHADADHIQAMSAARDRLKTKTASHAHAAIAIESGDVETTFARIAAQNFSIPLPPCKIDKRLADGDVLKIGNVKLEVMHTPGHTPGQLSFKLGKILFSGDNIYRDGGVGVIDAHHGSNLPDFIASLTTIRDGDFTHLLPSHGPAFKHDKKLIQRAIDRLTTYLSLPDFGTCATNWPLQEEWERDILAGRLPVL